MKMLAIRLSLLGLSLLMPAALAQSQAGQDALDSWLAEQTAIQYWQADVSQERHFRGLSQALKSTGKVWIAQPDRLRWELIEPTQTVAIRQGDQLRVHHPQLGEVEYFALDGDKLSPAGQQALALLGVGFPDSHEAFFKDYQLVSAEQAGTQWEFVLAPLSQATRRILDQVVVRVSADTWQLQGTEFRFPDGSRMRNEFTAHQTGLAPDPTLFAEP